MKFRNPLFYEEVFVLWILERMSFRRATYPSKQKKVGKTPMELHATNRIFEKMVLTAS